jgi:hypothetical protein
LLKYTDLPELTASIALRRVLLAGAVDAAGKKLSEEEVREVYRSAPNVDVLVESLWEPAAILRL